MGGVQRLFKTDFVTSVAAGSYDWLELNRFSAAVFEKHANLVR
jgi:hypothetical protein